MIQKASILMSDSKYKLGLFMIIDGSSIGWRHLLSEAKASKLFLYLCLNSVGPKMPYFFTTGLIKGTLISEF